MVTGLFTVLPCCSLALGNLWARPLAFLGLLPPVEALVKWCSMGMEVTLFALLPWAGPAEILAQRYPLLPGCSAESRSSPSTVFSQCCWCSVAQQTPQKVSVYTSKCLVTQIKFHEISPNHVGPKLPGM